MECPWCRVGFRGTMSVCPACKKTRGHRESWADAHARQHYAKGPRLRKSMPLAALFGIPVLAAMGAVLAAKSKPKYCEHCGQRIPEESE